MLAGDDNPRCNERWRPVSRRGTSNASPGPPRRRACARTRSSGSCCRVPFTRYGSRAMSRSSSELPSNIVRQAVDHGSREVVPAACEQSVVRLHDGAPDGFRRPQHDPAVSRARRDGNHRVSSHAGPAAPARGERCAPPGEPSGGRTVGCDDLRAGQPVPSIRGAGGVTCRTWREDTASVVRAFPAHHGERGLDFAVRLPCPAQYAAIPGGSAVPVVLAVEPLVSRTRLVPPLLGKDHLGKARVAVLRRGRGRTAVVVNGRGDGV